MCVCVYIYRERGRVRERETERPTDKETDRKKNRKGVRDWVRDSQTDIQKQREWVREESVIYSHNKYAYIHIYMFMQHHNDTIIKTHEGRKTQEDFFTKIYTSHFIARVRKGCSRVACERELETEHKLQYFDPTVMTVTLCLSCSLRLPNRGPRGSLCRMLAFFIAS